MNLTDHRALHAAIRDGASKKQSASAVKVSNTMYTAHPYGVCQGYAWGAWCIDLLKDETSTDIVASGEQGTFYCY
jgi:hypothetical protein